MIDRPAGPTFVIIWVPHTFLGEIGSVRKGVHCSRDRIRGIGDRAPRGQRNETVTPALQVSVVGGADRPALPKPIGHWQQVKVSPAPAVVRAYPYVYVCVCTYGTESRLLRNPAVTSRSGHTGRSYGDLARGTDLSSHVFPFLLSRSISDFACP